MSRTLHVQAEWPVAFKRDFNIITRELSRPALLFSLVIIKPSNWSIKLLYKKSSNEILAVQGSFLNRFNDTPTHAILSLSAIRLIWKYQQACYNDTAVIAKKRGRKNAIEQIFLTTAPWMKETTIFFLKIRVLSVSFLWTPFFQTQRILVLCYNMNPRQLFHLSSSTKYECGKSDQTDSLETNQHLNGLQCNTHS